MGKPHIAHRLTLRTARRIRGLTQEQLAEKAGVHHSLISLYESGQREILRGRYEDIVRIAQVLGVEPQELWPVDALDDALQEQAAS